MNVLEQTFSFFVSWFLFLRCLWSSSWYFKKYLPFVAWATDLNETLVFTSKFHWTRKSYLAIIKTRQKDNFLPHRLRRKCFWPAMSHTVQHSPVHPSTALHCPTLSCTAKQSKALSSTVQHSTMLVFAYSSLKIIGAY